MFKRILLPLDGSELAEITLPYGEELARRLGSELVLLHVRGQEEFGHIHQVYLDRLAESVASNTGSGTKKLKITTKVESGEPQESICRIVDENSVDLIIMTAVSSSGLKIGKMIGSVTDHVCRTVPIPVMLIRPQPQKGKQVKKKEQLINLILIPLDGSKLSKLALPVGEELASKLKVSTVLFRMANMVRLYQDDAEAGAFIDYATLNENEKKRVDTEMAALEKEMKKKHIDVSHLVTTGYDAAEDILEASKKTGSDLMIMSTHGRSGLGRFAFGSVAEKILRHGEIPLLLVNARAG